ncbi:hypothetical protein GN956_G11763 [Arapaima gigas]
MSSFTKTNSPVYRKLPSAEPQVHRYHMDLAAGDWSCEGKTPGTLLWRKRCGETGIKVQKKLFFMMFVIKQLPVGQQMS